MGGNRLIICSRSDSSCQIRHEAAGCPGRARPRLRHGHLTGRAAGARNDLARQAQKTMLWWRCHQEAYAQPSGLRKYEMGTTPISPCVLVEATLPSPKLIATCPFGPVS